MYKNCLEMIIILVVMLKPELFIEVDLVRSALIFSYSADHQ